jgi:hypothetical protein
MPAARISCSTLWSLASSSAVDAAAEGLALLAHELQRAAAIGVAVLHAVPP